MKEPPTVGRRPDNKFRIVEDGGKFYPQKRVLWFWFNMSANSAFSTDYYLTYEQAFEYIERIRVGKETGKKTHYL